LRGALPAGGCVHCGRRIARGGIFVKRSRCVVLRDSEFEEAEGAVEAPERAGAYIGMRDKSTFLKGRAGEDYAARTLEERGIRIVARNFRSGVGEIDLIGVEEETLVFFEVKCWSSYGIENLERSLSKKKRQRIIETAKYFLQKYREYISMAIRFDIIFIGYGGLSHIASAWTESL
jgi:putative endonuclease